MHGDDPYAPLASLYDAMASDPAIQAFYCEWADSLLEAAERLGLRVRTLVDLACGTGNSTIPWLRQREWVVVGVDRSEAMLREARRKSSRIDWYRRDLVDLDLPFRADAVTCHFDALNHVLSARSLQRAFHGVARLLNPGGLFQFDVNTGAILEWLGRHEKLFRVGEHYFVAVNEYDRRRHLATFHQHWFVARAGAGLRARDLYEHREVVVQERAYPRGALVAMLRRAGLRTLAIRAQRKVDGKPARLLFVTAREAAGRPGRRRERPPNRVR